MGQPGQKESRECKSCRILLVRIGTLGFTLREVGNDHPRTEQNPRTEC